MEPRIVQLVPLEKSNYRNNNNTFISIIALALVEQDGVQKMLYVGGDLPEARLLTEDDFES